MTKKTQKPVSHKPKAKHRAKGKFTAGLFIRLPSSLLASLKSAAKAKKQKLSTFVRAKLA